MHPINRKSSQYVPVYLALILLWALPLTAQDESPYVTMFTDHSIGDTIPVFNGCGNSKLSDGYIFVMTDATSCFTCSVSLGIIARAVKEKRLNIEIVAFMGGKPQGYCDIQKKRNSWDFCVIADPIYAYRNAYDLKAAPFFFVTDRSGRILLMDKCGGIHVSSSEITVALTKARVEHIGNSSATTLLEKRRTEVVDTTGTPLTLSDRTAILWAPTRTILYDAGMKLVHVVDTTGHTTRTWDLQRFGMATLSPLEPSWAYGDSVVLGASVSLNPPGSRIFYLFNINTGELRNLDFNDGSLDAMYYNVQTKSAFDPVTSRVFVGIRPRKNQKLTGNTPMMIMIDTNGREIQRFGRADSTFIRYSMSHALSTLVGSDGHGTIYECQSPTRTLNVYDHDGKLIRSLSPNYGSYRKDFAEDMQNNPGLASMEYWVGVNSRGSHSMHIFPSSNGREVALVYMNAEYPKGVTDPHSSQARLPLYLHRMTSDGTRIDNNDIPLPLGSKPFFVDDNTVGVAEFEHNHVSFVWYEITGSVN